MPKLDVNNFVYTLEIGVLSGARFESYIALLHVLGGGFRIDLHRSDSGVGRVSIPSLRFKLGFNTRFQNNPEQKRKAPGFSGATALKPIIYRPTNFLRITPAMLSRPVLNITSEPGSGTVDIVALVTVPDSKSYAYPS